MGTGARATNEGTAGASTLDGAPSPRAASLEAPVFPVPAGVDVDGRPLNQLADALTVEQVALLLRDAAEGVHAAHRAGLIHRDLKPGNILVERTEDGRLKPYVMDFGLARDRTEQSLTATGAVLGTPHYMAPEQARGEVSRLDRRADVYSLGATLYTALTGLGGHVTEQSRLLTPRGRSATREGGCPERQTGARPGCRGCSSHPPCISVAPHAKRGIRRGGQ
ncbi:serine/threonine-protein kinase [Myxococcus sp. SDU36]|uniref:serine/threonine-protein kinase n=1 Tax=Myxococcus sp. SDU36 TaxID=2831967 RepID=UPI002543E982|nr:serine/threonine-protein kinase [Myxococcus sp. SDU36]WIG98730.1 serine/threonine protein kinase [Myxococcus sp. SDU36]